MNDTGITDQALDDLLSPPSAPIKDDGFSQELLTRLEKREKLLRTIPFVLGIIGAAITSFFIPTEIFYGLASAFTSKAGFIALASSPMALAIMLSTPLALLLFSSD